MGDVMDAARWDRIQTLFHDVVERPPSEWRAALAAACAGDAALAEQVLAMLEEDARGASLLDRGVADAAGRVLGERAATLPSERFGAYRIRSVLGEGGMGVVYLAEREDLGSVAAIKILRDGWLSSARRERFASEQRTLAQLNHPSIARLYDAGVRRDGTPWFVMEYVDGLPLTTHCARRGSSMRERLALFRAVCEAVQHAHRHAVIHRDLKPSNVLVTRDGAPKLLDFGIAKQLDDGDVPADRTRTGLRLMTPAYAAPEQLRGGRVGIHTDIYSLGVVLYELMAGQLPFDLTNASPGETEAIIAERAPEKPSVVARRMEPAHARSVSRAAWGDLDVLCLTAMHKDPQRRYATVDALIRDVEHYLMGEPLGARPDGARYRLRKFARRHWRPVSAAAAALAMIIALTVYYTIRLATARNAAMAEAARTQRIQRFMLGLFQGDERESGPADSLRVVTLVDRGVREARSLDAEPTVQAELYQTLGGISQQLGNLSRADSLLGASLDERRRVLGADHPDVAASLVSLGLLRVDQAKLDDAERLIRDGLAMSRRLRPAGHPEVAHATEAFGRVLQERGAYDSAIAVLGEAVTMRTAPRADDAELAASLGALADAHFYAGHYDASDSLNRRVLAMRRALHGERHPLVADVLLNLGATQFQRGHYADAEQYDRRALDIIRSWYGVDHPETAHAITMLARALIFENRQAEASALLAQALTIQERVYGPVHPLVASALNEIGTLALQDERLDEAAAYFTRMADITRSVYGAKHQVLATALSNLASVYVARKDYARAEPLYRQAVAIYTEALSPVHVNTAIGRIKLGRTLLREGRFADAERESRAGYEILVKEADPAVSYLRAARRDLVAAYDSMGTPGKGARYRAELAEMERRAADDAAKK